MFDPSAFHLFDLNAQETLYEAIRNLSIEDLQESFYYAIVSRGESYYRSNLVTEVKVTPDRINAVVTGSDNYQAVFYRERNQIYGKCNCPYDGPCKHLAALALHLILEPEDALEIETAEQAKEKVQKIDQYLDTLSKKKLINLLKEVAPVEYWDNLLLQLDSRDESQKPG